MLKYPALVRKEEGEMLGLEFPDLENVFTVGKSWEELVINAEDALALHLGVLFDEGHEIPEPSRLVGENIVYVDVPPHVALPIMLRKLRREKGLSQTDVARRIHRSYQTYQRFENVKNFNARMKTLEEVARAMGKTLRVDIV